MTTQARPLIWRRTKAGWYVSEIKIGADKPRQWTIVKGPASADGCWRGFWCGVLISGATSLAEQKNRLNAAAWNLCHPQGTP